jgi:hypothetical protein
MAKDRHNPQNAIVELTAKDFFELTAEDCYNPHDADAIDD